MSEKFDLDMIEKSFVSYKKGQCFEGVVVMVRPDGCIFNIGGKNDAFLPASDIDNFSDVKIGDRFSVVITNQKNEDGLIEVSKSLADALKTANQNAQNLRLGSRFSFVVTGVNEEGLLSKMGNFQVFIPSQEVGGTQSNLHKLIGKQLEAVVTEKDTKNLRIIGSVKLLKEQVKVAVETNFWNSIFVNKIISGKVVRIMPYGAFVNVDGVDCFLHISQISYQRLEKVEDSLSVGDEKEFKVINVDRVNKKVELSLKALLENPKLTKIKELDIGGAYAGKVVKLLQFGAIVELENGATGLMHISNATEDRSKKIYEIVKIDDSVQVEVISKDEAEMKVAFKLIGRN